MTRPAMALAILLALAGSPMASAAEFRTSDVTGQGYDSTFPGLVAQDGSAWGRANFTGHITLLLFGFTYCPDVCPTALANLAAVRDLLAGVADAPQIVFVTIDPQRDTPAVLRDYLASFGPGVTGLTGPPSALRRMADSFHVIAHRVPLAGGDYTMDHSITEFALDSTGRTRLLFTADRHAADIAHDVAELQREDPRPSGAALTASQTR